MADNYLENKFDALLSGGNARRVVKRNNPSLDTLLHRSRSVRGYDSSFKVSEDTLRKIVEVNTLLPSGRNQQVLRFRIVTSSSGASDVLANIRMGGALPELHLPLPGTEPEAFIIVCSEEAENRIIDMDLGISLHGMALKAAEMGLGSLIICSLNKEAIMKALGLEIQPLAILAVGKSSESIFLKPIKANEDHNYYRKDGIHYVPKVCLQDLLI